MPQTAEKLAIEPLPSEKSDAISGGPSYKILSYPADYTLEVLHRKWKEDELLIANFQRGFVWTHTQASRLIESFLMGLPVPQVFLYADSVGKHLVVDGHQRLRSVFAFFEGKLPDGRTFSLRDVQDDWNGKLYEDLAEQEKRKLRDSVLRAMILKQVHPEDMTSVYHVFERLNTGGTSLTPQEIRNCVYHGPFNDFVISINEDSNWRKILGSQAPDKRMRDVELIVRFFALFEGYRNYTKPMKDFISSFMRRHQERSQSMEYETLFRTTVAEVVDKLGEKPFHIKRGLNAAVFDSVMVAFASKTGVIPPNIGSRFSTLLKDQNYSQNTTSGTTDEKVVEARIEIAKRILFSP